MLGSNVPTVGGLSKGFYWAKKWKCEAIQIYVTLSRRWELQKTTSAEINKFKRTRKKSPVKRVVAHIPFLVNLASPNKELLRKSKKRLVKELFRANEFGVSLLVLHPGSYGNSTKKDAIKQIVEGLREVIKETKNTKTKILLETMAGQGTSIGSKFEEIAYILKRTDNLDRLGVCFDTAHVFIAGYDIRGYRGYQKVLDEFDKVVGLEKIRAFHLNDSKTALGSGNDRHSCIGEGKMGLQVFHALLKDQRFLNIPKILEIPERDKRSEDNLTLLRELSQKEKEIPEPKGLVFTPQLF